MSSQAADMPPPAVPEDNLSAAETKVPESEAARTAEPAEATEPPKAGRRGRGLGMATLFIIAALAIIGGAIGIVGALTHGFHKPVTVKYREWAVFKLRMGDCVNAPNGRLVAVLPCSAPHEAEVFATFTLPDSRWPGTPKVRAEASSGCASRLTGYLNPQLAISLSQSYVFPDAVAWRAGTRTVICEVRATSGQLTGSVRG
jgi:putative regulator of septum formation